jgi:hypothetical protein
MPCYLFTYHAYGSWMPDRTLGYVKRNRGILAADASMARKYERIMNDKPVLFDESAQETILVSILESRAKQSFDAHFIATDPTHVHLLLAWRDSRTWLRMRSSIKRSQSHRLNMELGRRDWFVEGGSRKRVKDREHYDYLVTHYLPKHTG